MAKAGLLFVGTDDGLVLFSNPNEIGRWLKIGQPFRGAAVQAVWAVPENPLRVLAAVEGQGVHGSDDGGQSWQALFDWPAQAIVGNAAGAIHIRAPEAVFASHDQGNTWAQQPVAGPGGLLAITGDYVYAVSGEQVLRNAGGGGSWANYGQRLPASAQGLAAAPQQPGLLYAVAGGQVYRCDGPNSAWERVEGAPAARGPIAALPGKASALLVAAASGGIARSDDQGAAWAVALPEGDIDGVVPASYHVDTAFAGGADGQLLGSTDRGRSWQVAKPGLPAIRCIAAARLV